MVTQALVHLSNHQGTKNEIFQKVSDIYGVSLENPENSLCKTLNQALSKFFTKTSPQVYALNPSNVDFINFQLGKNPSMKQMIIFTMLKMD